MNMPHRRENLYDQLSRGLRKNYGSLNGATDGLALNIYDLQVEQPPQHTKNQTAQFYSQQRVHTDSSAATTEAACGAYKYNPSSNRQH